MWIRCAIVLLSLLLLLPRLGAAAADQSYQPGMDFPGGTD